MAFCPEHPKWDQNLKFIPLSEPTSIPFPFHMGSPPPSAQSPQMVLVPCLGIRGGGGGGRLRAEGLKQEERTSLHRIMRWDVKKNSWMLHAPTIDFRITMYIPYSEQRGQWRGWGGGRGAACLCYHQEYFGCSWFSVVSFTATTYML